MRLRRLIAGLLLRRPENPRDRSRQRVPLAGLKLQLPPALGCQPVELGPAIVFRGALLDRNPSALDKPVQRGIQRPLFDQQHIIGLELNGLCDSVTVRRPKQEGTQDQEVQGALQQLDALLLSFSRHST